MDQRTPPPTLTGSAALVWYRQEMRRDFLAYLLVHGTLVGATLLALPILTRHLSAAQLGLFGIIEASVTLAISVSMLGLKFAYLQWVADRPVQRRGPVLGTVLLLTFVAGLIAGGALALVFGSATLGAWLDIGDTVSPGALILLVAVANQHTIFTTDLRARRRPRLLIAVSVVQLGVMLAATYGLVALAGWGVTGAVLAHMLAFLASSLLLWLSIRRHLVLRVDRDLIGPMLRYGAPAMAGITVRYLLDASARWLIALMVSLEAAGDFLIAVKVADLFMALLVVPFWMAWGGHVYHVVKRADASDVVSDTVTRILHWALVLVLLILAGAPVLFDLVGAGDRHLAKALLFPVLGHQLAWLLQPTLSAGLISTRRMWWKLRYAALALAVFLVTGPVSTALLGAYGAAYAWLVAEWLNTLATARASHAIIPMRLPHYRYAATALALGITIFLI